MSESWYRNAGRRTKYHLAAPGWVRSGRAVCGANIARPGYVADKREQIPACVGACKRCERGVS